MFNRIFNRSVTSQFDFVGKSPFFVTLSAVLVLLSLVLVGWKGLNYGIDFAGGTELQFKFKRAVEVTEIRQALKQVGMEEARVQSYGAPEDHEFILRVGKTSVGGISKEISQSFEQKFGAGSFELRKDDSVGPKVGKELRVKSVSAIVVTLVLLLIYIWLRFDMLFAPGAILALFHDVTLTLGAFCLFGMEVDLSVLAALLTLAGYSLNDTIVIYDRIRENRHRMQGATLSHIINDSVNQTLSRTIMTSGATMLVTLALLYFGGEILHNFAFALSFGIVVGSYSTIYIASPIALIIDKYLEKKKPA